jgi:uncharacterized protein YjiS (DUF1127 family)
MRDLALSDIVITAGRPASGRRQPALVALLGWWRRYLVARRTERALARLDDRLLKDIGIDRSSIPLISDLAGARDAAWRRPL